jgi:hypothetical protein
MGPTKQHESYLPVIAIYGLTVYNLIKLKKIGR